MTNSRITFLEIVELLFWIKLRKDLYYLAVYWCIFHLGFSSIRKPNPQNQTIFADKARTS